MSDSTASVATPELDRRIAALAQRDLPTLFGGLEPGLSKGEAKRLDAMLHARATRWGQVALVEPAALAAILIAGLEPEALAARQRALPDTMYPTSSTLQRVIALTLLVLSSTIDTQIAAADHDQVSLTRAICAWLVLRLNLPLKELGSERAEVIWSAAELSLQHWTQRVKRLAGEYEATQYAGRTPT